MGVIKKVKRGQQDGLAYKGTCSQNWQPGFSPQNPHDRRRDLPHPGGPLTSTHVLWRLYSPEWMNDWMNEWLLRLKSEKACRSTVSDSTLTSRMCRELLHHERTELSSGSLQEDWLTSLPIFLTFPTRWGPWTSSSGPLSSPIMTTTEDEQQGKQSTLGSSCHPPGLLPAI